MSKQIDKDKLLKWLESLPHHSGKQHIMNQICSVAFDTEPSVNVGVTDEQREEIQKFMIDTMFNFGTNEMLFNRIAEGRRLINLLQASEQAWKEKYTKLLQEFCELSRLGYDNINKLMEQRNKANDDCETAQMERNEIREQLNQAIEVIRQLLPEEISNRCEVINARNFLSSLPPKKFL